VLTSLFLDRSIGWSVERLSTLPPESWQAPSTGTAWTVHRTVDHIVDMLLFFATQVATRSPSELPPVRDGDPGATPEELIVGVGSAGTVLSRLLDDMGLDDRAFHPSGLADRTGWAAMACAEVLVHTYDVAPGDGPADVAAEVVGRLFPWIAVTPDNGVGPDPWSLLLWATGRVSLPGMPDTGPDWRWQAAPPNELDGVPRESVSPPQWD
jgi:hypothetical protein